MDFLSLIILGLIGILAYVYWVQGLVSGLITAVLAVVSALMALSYADPLVGALLGGRFADQATAIALCSIFAVVFIVLRVVFDKFVPGNARFPVMVDHVGGAIGGAVAGIAVGGIIAIAAQTLPFGVTALGNTRFELVDRSGIILAGDRNLRYETYVANEVKGGRLDPANRGGLWLPVDDILVGIASAMSQGALAGTNRFSDVHPDFLDEIFGSRLGLPSGAKFTAMNVGDRNDVTVRDLFLIPERTAVPQIDGELKEVRPTDDTELEKTRSPQNGRLFVVRVLFTSDAADTDQRVRFATGNAPLVAGGTTHFPIGTLHDGSVFVRQYVDDPLVIAAGAQGVDLVYDLPLESIVSGEGENAKIRPGTLLRVKRLGRIDLSGRPVKQEVPPREQMISVQRKSEVLAAAEKAAGRPSLTPGERAQQPAPTPPADDAPATGGGTPGAIDPRAPISPD
jgi:hypothetical protein